jgi:ParB family chromosome partitioning protein
VEGFFGAQQEWLLNNLPQRGTLVPVDENGSCQLPKRAERVWGKPGKGDVIGHFVNARTGEVDTVAYRLPAPKKAGKPTDGAGTTSAVGRGDDGDTPVTKTRADVTQRGVAMIGDLRTDALHQALADTPISLFGLMILAFGGNNVTVDSCSGAQ